MSRYGYAVTDDQGLDFNQQETSDGGVVTGQYSVVLPDGRYSLIMMITMMMMMMMIMMTAGSRLSSTASPPTPDTWSV